MKSGVRILKKKNQNIKHYISESRVHLSPANWDASKNVRAQENNLSVEKHRTVQFIACCRLRRSNGLWSTFLGQYDLKYRERSQKKNCLREKIVFFHKEGNKYFCGWCNVWLYGIWWILHRTTGAESEKIHLCSLFGTMPRQLVKHSR